MFEAQTYPAKELIVIDDQMEPSFPDSLSRAGIRYVVSVRHPIGAKRNMAVSMAAGAVIMHWDSDDIYRADRIEHQVGMLLTNEVDIVGYHTMETIRTTDGIRRLCVCKEGYCIGVSLCYWREIWEKRPYCSIMAGEDDIFQGTWRKVTVPADGRIIVRAHPGNTVDKMQSMDVDKKQWQEMAA